jgi:hypothetical protein
LDHKKEGEAMSKLMPADDEVAVTLVFSRPIEQWSEEDRREILQRLRQFMDDPAGFRRQQESKKGTPWTR